MFDSIYSASVTAGEFFTMAGISLAAGLLYAWILSFQIRANRRFFLVLALIPFCVAAVITFVSGNIGAGVAVGGAFALIRFRSAQGSSDEIAALLVGMAGGIAFGNGYVGYGACILLGLSVLYFGFASLPIFDHKAHSAERLLKLTIPESLDYNGVFDSTFRRYLSSWSSAGVKTTGMGSMFRLSFKITMKSEAEEKALIDELRTKNGNLEIAILPWTEPTNTL